MKTLSTLMVTAALLSGCGSDSTSNYYAGETGGGTSTQVETGGRSGTGGSGSTGGAGGVVGTSPYQPLCKLLTESSTCAQIPECTWVQPTAAEGHCMNCDLTTGDCVL